MQTIVILTEDALTDADVTHVTGLFGADVTYRVLVPADTEANVLVSIIDRLALGELRTALDAALGRFPRPASAHATAREQLAESLTLFERAGFRAEGTVVEDDPLPALQGEVVRLPVSDVVVLTYPHALEDTFGQDWASRARDLLQVPVLHVYLGTSTLG